MLRNPSFGIPVAESQLRNPTSCGILVAESCAVAELDFIRPDMTPVSFCKLDHILGGTGGPR